MIAGGMLVAAVLLAVIYIVAARPVPRSQQATGDEGGTILIGTTNSQPADKTATNNKNLTINPSASPGASAPVFGSATGNNGSGDSQNEAGITTTDPTKFSQFDRFKDEGSVKYVDITPGDGAVVSAGRTLSLHYRGWLTNGTLFDQSYDRGAYSFTLGHGKVIPGWEDGVGGMKVGGKRRLVVPPSRGYGNTARGPIPAGSVLVFDIELLEVK